MKNMISELDQENGLGKTESPVRNKETLRTPVKGNGAELVGHRNKNRDIVKSPSDTTVYVLVLKRIVRNPEKNEDIMVNQISNFIEGIRVQEATNNSPVNVPRPGTSGDGSRNVRREEVEDARSHAAQMIVDAENYEAAMINPTGMDISNGNSQSVRQVAIMDTDDEFFHLTCHVDPALRGKIQKGEFVELERLLPKEKFAARHNEGRMELVNKDGMTFFVPAKEMKINNVRKWEQAFRVYGAIYSEANPHRSAEIWQYVFIINSAASAYQWDNVAYYDFTFRQLMAANPNHNWGKIYNQMWNLAMRDPINKIGFSSQGFHSDEKGQGSGKKRSNYCWKFNKSSCTEGKSCNFPHRCYFCDAFSHGIQSCRKQDKKEQQKTNGNGNHSYRNGKPGNREN